MHSPESQQAGYPETRHENAAPDGRFPRVTAGIRSSVRIGALAVLAAMHAGSPAKGESGGNLDNDLIVRENVDEVVINHVFNEQNRRTYSQFLFYRKDPESRQMEVVASRFMHNDMNIRLLQDQKTGSHVMLWEDKEHSWDAKAVTREITTPIIYESPEKHDIDLQEQMFVSRRERAGFLPALTKKEAVQRMHEQQWKKAMQEIRRAESEERERRQFIEEFKNMQEAQDEEPQNGDPQPTEADPATKPVPDNWVE